MANTSDIGGNPVPSILLVGDSGTFKTRFLGTVPDIYIFDFDKGLASLRGLNVEYDTFKDAPRGSKVVNEKLGIYEWGKGWTAFIKRLNVLGAEIDKGMLRPLAFDSITTLSSICMNYVLYSNNTGGPPQIQHWGQQIALLETVMDQLTSWPVPKIVTAHIQRHTNGVTQVMEMLPLVTGKLAGKIGIYFDEVYFMQVKKNKDGTQEPFLQTISSGMLKQAKSRYGVPDETRATWEEVRKYVVETA